MVDFISIQKTRILALYGVDLLEKAKSVPVGTINKYGEQKQQDGTWKYVKLSHRDTQHTEKALTPEDIWNSKGYKEKFGLELGSDEEEDIDHWHNRYHAKTKNYKPNTYYRVVAGGAGTGIANVGKGLYLGRDKQALLNFYGNVVDPEEEREIKLMKFIGTPKWADLLDEKKYKEFEKEAVAKYKPDFHNSSSTTEAFAESIKKLAIERGYDGIRYYDPFATGEEFVLFNDSKVKESK